MKLSQPVLVAVKGLMDDGLYLGFLARLSPEDVFEELEIVLRDGAPSFEISFGSQERGKLLVSPVGRDYALFRELFSHVR